MIKLSNTMDGLNMKILAEIDTEKLGRHKTLPSEFIFPDRFNRNWEFTFHPYQENNIYPHSRMFSLGHLGKKKIKFELDPGYDIFKIWMGLNDIVNYINTL